MTFPDIYDALGWPWEKCPLSYGLDKKGRMVKTGVYHGYGKIDTPNPHTGITTVANGYILHTDDLLVVDIDGDTPKSRELVAMCEAAEPPTQQTKKGKHYVFKAHPKIHTNKNSTHQIDIRANGGILLVEPSFYMIDGHKQEYKWIRPPREAPECPEEIVAWLLKHQQTAPKDEPKPKAKPVPKNTITHVPNDDSDAEAEAPLAAPPIPETPKLIELDGLLGCLSVERLSDSVEWRRIAYALKNVEDTEAVLGLLLKHSRRCPEWDTDEAEAHNRIEWNTMKPSGRSGIGSIKHFAKKDNPDKYFNDRAPDAWGLIGQNNAISFCRLFYMDMAGDLLYSKAEKSYYVYSTKHNLWTKHEDKAGINFLFIERTHDVFRRLNAALGPSDTDDDEASKKAAKRKVLIKAKAYCDKGGAITLVSSFLPAIATPELDPANYFNQDPNLLPLQNGVWNFKEKRLMDYQRDHFFTFKIPINYNPKADTTDIAKAFKDWFRSPAVADYIRMWLGYCLTGFTDKQEFLIVWGSSAGNGKSLLWGTILNILTGDPDDPAKTFYRTINSDALSAERTGNNDQLYDLNGGRVAFLSEPRRTKATKIDNELLKTLTGDKFFTAEKKYKNAITFRLTSKFVSGVNDLPDLKFQDQGTYRRVKVVEQNTKFVDAADYATADPTEKADGRIKCKDDAFVGRLLANKEGLLLWALMGANDYIDNPRREAPSEMNAARDKAAGELDKLGNWVKANISNLNVEKPSGYEKKKMTFKAIKELLKHQGLNLGQNDCGFNRVFKEKCMALGFEIGGRDDKGDLYLKYAMEIPDETTNVVVYD